MAVSRATPVRVRVLMRFFSIFCSFLLSPGSSPVRRRDMISLAAFFVNRKERFETPYPYAFDMVTICR